MGRGVDGVKTTDVKKDETVSPEHTWRPWFVWKTFLFGFKIDLSWSLFVGAQHLSHSAFLPFFVLIVIIIVIIILVLVIIIVIVIIVIVIIFVIIIAKNARDVATKKLTTLTN